MTFARRIYTKEFRINAAKSVVDEHRPATSVAEELNVSPKTLHSRVKHCYFYNVELICWGQF